LVLEVVATYFWRFENCPIRPVTVNSLEVLVSVSYDSGAAKINELYTMHTLNASV
jgi:hypothetical protein